MMMMMMHLSLFLFILSFASHKFQKQIGPLSSPSSFVFWGPNLAILGIIMSGLDLTTTESLRVTHPSKPSYFHHFPL
jgi:uncharacterized membrane protein